MILAIDVGNSNIVLGCLENGQVLRTARLETDPRQTEAGYTAALTRVLTAVGVDVGAFEGAVLSSVVAPVTEPLRRAAEKLTGRRVLVIDNTVKTGLDIRIRQPETVAGDLLAAAVAAVRYYPLPLIVVDMGTATTFTVLDRQGRFLGGAIAPGVRLSLDALTARTQLPAIPLDASPKAIGDDTETCMQSGVLCGAAAMLDGMAARLEDELGEPASVLATGGLAAAVIPLCKRKVLYDEHLLLRGLGVLWEMNMDRE